jgi:hypothetical protein
LRPRPTPQKEFDLAFNSAGFPIRKAHAGIRHTTDPQAPVADMLNLIKSI